VKRPAALILLLACGAISSAQDRAAWMPQAQWGVMTHYLADWQARAHNLDKPELPAPAR
jgi:hypothetical protein